MTTDSRSDGELLKTSAKDAEAFGRFFDRHGGAVLGYFINRTADRELAADLTAETFAQAFAARRRYRDTGAPATSWLFTIAARQLSGFHRKQRVSDRYRRRMGLAPLESVDEFERIDELDELAARLPELRAALSELTPESAAAVMGRVGRGQSYSEIAEQLGCTPAAARVRVSRALSRLHDRMSEMPSDRHDSGDERLDRSVDKTLDTSIGEAR